MAANDTADENIIVTPSESWNDQEKLVKDGVASALSENKVDAIICVAGGWAGGNASHKGKLCSRIF